ASAPDHLQESPPRVMVLLVGLQVLGELVDPLGEDRDLHLGRARVGLVAAVAVDDLRLRVLGQHAVSPLSQPRRSRSRTGSSYARGDAVAPRTPGSDDPSRPPPRGHPGRVTPAPARG